MFAIAETGQSGQNNTSSQAQQQLIASVVAQQKVIAAQRSTDMGDATTGGHTGHSDNARALKNASVMQRETDDKVTVQQQEVDASTEAKSEEARSVIEAQEASAVDQKITKAFMARHELNDLLSVIRDPDDQLLPVDPAGLR